MTDTSPRSASGQGADTADGSSGPDGSLDPGAPGGRLLDAVAVMDTLRSPGGCPWDAEQTHRSLLRYLVEECYELVQAIEDDDRAAMREELGDVLLQVLFHARVAAEIPPDHGGFTIDDVAGDLVDKLVRRHPQVFAADAPPESAPATAQDQQSRWDEVKKTERAGKNGRAHALDGVALAQPAAALAGKLGSRAAKFGDSTPLPDGDNPAEQLFRIAYAAGAAGIDPETALREVARAHAERMRANESAGEPAHRAGASAGVTG